MRVVFDGIGFYARRVERLFAYRTLLVEKVTPPEDSAESILRSSALYMGQIGDVLCRSRGSVNCKRQFSFSRESEERSWIMDAH